MTYFLLALGLGFIGALPILLCPAKYESWDRKTPAQKRSATLLTLLLSELGYTLLGWLIIYGGLPTAVWPMGITLSLLLLLWWIISMVITFIRNGGESWSHAVWPPLVFIVALFFVAISGWGLFHASSYAKLIGDVNTKTSEHWSQEIQPLDPTHIRLVPKEYAVALARTTLSQDGTTLGSQFPLDTAHVTLQKIRNQYWYLIPLDYKGWKVWTGDICVPGYAKISATDPYAKPLLVTGKKIKYTLGAFFSDHLDRKIYWKYVNKELLDYSFEEDEDGNIFWVITVMHPTISFFGSVVDGVILYNPETGEDTFVSKQEVNENPKYAWIDRVVPMDLIKNYINEWGTFSGGWWNQAWSSANLLMAETPTLNYSADGRCVIVTPVTSTNSADGAMTGLMYTDARTGVSTYYAVSGGASEESVSKAVKDIVKFKYLHPSSQIVFENIYGKLSALIPILSESDKYQGLAIVEAVNMRVAIGATPQEALISYQKVLMNAGGQVATESIKNTKEYTGTITRLGWEISASDAGKQYYIYFKDFKNSFMISSTTQSELSLTREGDIVTIKYIASDQAAVPVMDFKNLTLNLQSSKNEQAVKAEVNGRADANQIKADVKDFKEEIKDMSDDEIRKIMNGKK
jgi:hypothetical protein